MPSNNKYKFPCGCEFDIVGPCPYPKHNTHPAVDIDIEKIPLNCPATWELIGSGRTKGVFQLESSLGKTWSKKLKPNQIEHLTALGSILRPGALKALDENGVSTTEHYVLRKNNLESVAYDHPALETTLKKT